MSLWMRQGRIKLTQNSKYVVGVGTSFLSAAVPARPGQPLVVNGMMLEIADVNSDTSITLADSYTGATAENLPYFVMTTMEGSYNDLARRAAQVMGYYQGYMDVYNELFTGSGTVSVQLPDGSVCNLPAWGNLQPKDTTLTAMSGVATAKDKLLYFTGLDTCAATTLTPFARSLLDDANAQSALATLTAYGRSNILGSVSQSSGAPTGAIVERGKNANGEFVKFADGTLMCVAVRTLEYTSSPNFLQDIWTLPAPHADGVGVSFMMSQTTDTGVRKYNRASSSGGATTSAATSSVLRLWATGTDVFAPGDATAPLAVLFIGRWF